QVQYVQDTIGQIQNNVGRIEELHGRSLVNISDDQSTQITQQMDRVVDETRRCILDVKGRIKAIEIANQKVPASSGDLQMRKTQCGQLKKKFMDVVQRYQQVEQQFRQKYRERMERQFRIVRPNATQEEVDAALDANDGSQLFAQELVATTRYGEAKRALREVQERHEDIKRIEKTILELHALFQEMQTLVESQGEMIDSIENNVSNAANYTETAVKHIDTAIVHRKNARKRTWCLIALAIVLVIVIIVVVYTQVIAPGMKVADIIPGTSPSPSPAPAPAATPTPAPAPAQ
ncbi:t-SNARE, partial [Thamnocephalis sphaerospora]